MSDETFNGHPSWEHWNVALWVGNDEGLYNMAREDSKASFIYFAMYCLVETPDGARYTEELAGYAWDSVNED